MCLLGKEKSEWSAVGAFQVRCNICNRLYRRAEWDRLHKSNTPEATTTMGGDSKGDSSSDNEVHTVVLTVFPAKTFGYLLDGGPCNMCNVMDVMSKAVEDYCAEVKRQPALKWWSPGTQAAYERLGRALGVAVPAPAAMNTEEHVDPVVLAEAPAPSPPPKLAQRLAAFVEERHALEQACKAFDEAGPKTSWAQFAFTAAVMDGLRAACSKTMNVADGWQEGGDARLKYEQAGFKVMRIQASETNDDLRQKCAKPWTKMLEF